MNKYLIIRFSSFGDVAQALPAASVIRREDPQAQIHWVTRSDFTEFVKLQSAIDQVWSLDKKTGLRGLYRLAKTLRDEKYTRVYDAHANLRSFLICSYLFLTSPSTAIVRRSKNRMKRFLLFKLRINMFGERFKGLLSFLQPLAVWFKNIETPAELDFNYRDNVFNLPFALGEAIVLAPSATWALKRWPSEYWQQFVRLNPTHNFIVTGGAGDAELCAQITKSDPSRVHNLAGRLSWAQSTQLISMAKILVSGDTGMLHVADILGQKVIALIGPTAFGYPTRNTSHVLEVSLPCKPCTKDGRGKCSNETFKKCLIDITPQMVTEKIKSLHT